MRFYLRCLYALLFRRGFKRSLFKRARVSFIAARNRGISAGARGNNFIMRKINFALISDSIFTALCAFLLSFTLIRFYLKSAAAALAVAIMCAVAAFIFAFIALYFKRAKTLSLSNDAREQKTLALHLSVSGEKYIENLFMQAFDGTYPEGNRLEDGENAYFLFFTLSPLSPDDVARAIKCKTDKKKIILCCSAGESGAQFARDFDIEIRQIGYIYDLLKSRKLLPEKYACGEIKKVSFFKKIKRRFNRRLCPSLFFCGLSLLFFSFFTYFRFYYIACGGLLLLLSVVCLFIGEAKG